MEPYGGYTHCSLIPRTQLEVVYILMSNEAHIFLIMTPKFQLQIQYCLEGTAENVPIIGIPNLIL